MPRILDASADGSDISIPVGEHVVLTLDENRTTGFAWQVVSGAEPVLALHGDTFEPPATLGAGGSHVWDFEASQSGQAQLKLAYARAWDPSSAARAFYINVKVE